jgi:molecular chaperone GrpE
MVLARTSKRDVGGDSAKEPKVTGNKEVFEDEAAGARGGESEPSPAEQSVDGDKPGSAGKDQARDAKEELAAERDKYLRLAAEYDNYRKRSIKERETIYYEARADAITRLLPVYDNLERALKADCTDEAFYKGVEMTMTQLTEILDGFGVKPIPAAGEPFDPKRHNAVMTIENPELGEKIVAEEYQKGFMLGDRVLRFSTVVVAN